MLATGYVPRLGEESGRAWAYPLLSAGIASRPRASGLAPTANATSNATESRGWSIAA